MAVSKYVGHKSRYSERRGEAQLVCVNHRPWFCRKNLLGFSLGRKRCTIHKKGSAGYSKGRAATIKVSLQELNEVAVFGVGIRTYEHNCQAGGQVC